ncbi:MAG: hypothetical protein OEY64_02980, partial [Nitrospinota bacterium]|nr:hypothetical protein [Nitrospinota bacterium]
MFSLLSVSVTFESALAREDEDGTNETLKKTKKKKRRSVRKLEFSPYGEVFYGKESNVFKSPDSIVNHPIYGTHTDIVKDDSFVETAVGLDVKGRLRKNKELTFEYNYEETKYAKYSILDEISTDIGFDYLQRMSKRSKIKLKTGYKQSDKISVDVFGLEYPYKISYESLTLNPILYHKYRPGIFGKHSGNTLMKLSYEMKSKNYAEPLPPNLSYDYVQDKITLDVTQEIDKTLDI